MKEILYFNYDMQFYKIAIIYDYLGIKIHVIKLCGTVNFVFILFSMTLDLQKKIFSE